MPAKKTSGTKVKTILISQPKPLSDKSPFYDLSKKKKVKIDFRAFVHLEGVTGKDFRKSKINISEFTAIIFTSKNAITHFFRIAEEMRVKMSMDTKYFCSSETIALYLQKFVEYRKRKVFFDKGGKNDLFGLLKKHKEKEKFLYPCADLHTPKIPDFLEENEFDYSKAVIYKLVSSDLSDLEDILYDMIVFFTPLGIKSLYDNFPKFKQNKTRLAAYGKVTAQAIKDKKLRLDIEAPTPETPSITMAISKYLDEVNK